MSLAIVGGSYLFLSNGEFSSEASASVSIGLEDSLPAYGVKTTDELIEFWRGRFQRDPRDYISLTYLGQAFIRKARETGDLGAQEQAESTLRSALTLNPNYETTLAYLSTALLMKHDFQGAADIADRLYAFDPQALQALVTLGDAQLELGNYTEAAAAYTQLAQLNSSPPVYSRLAHMAWLHGRPEEALDYMHRAVADAATSGYTGQSAAWYQYRLGELYYEMGRIEDAANHYSAAMDLFDDYYLAIEGLGKVHAAQGMYAKAIDLFERFVAIAPHPDAVAYLGDLDAPQGNMERAEIQYETVEHVAKLPGINEQVYNRVLVIFYADHNRNLSEALERATSELTVRRDIYGYDALAWALYKNNRIDEAVEAITEAMRLGTENASLYYHAGMIYYGADEDDQARQYLEQALALSSDSSPLIANDIRRTLAEIRAGDVAG